MVHRDLHVYTLHRSTCTCSRFSSTGTCRGHRQVGSVRLACFFALLLLGRHMRVFRSALRWKPNRDDVSFRFLCDIDTDHVDAMSSSLRLQPTNATIQRRAQFKDEPRLLQCHNSKTSLGCLPITQWPAFLIIHPVQIFLVSHVGSCHTRRTLLQFHVLREQ